MRTDVSPLIMHVDQRILREFEARAKFPLTERNLVFLARIGSHSHGTYVPPEDPQAIDDVDYMGVVIPPPERVFGLVEYEGTNFMLDELDVVFYSFSKFVRLLVKSNPNVLGTLWLRNEDYVYQSHGMSELTINRELFSSKQAHTAFAGYADGQLKRMTHFNQALLDEYTRAVHTIERDCGLTVREVLEADEHKLKHLYEQHFRFVTLEGLRRFKGLHRQHFSGYMGEKRKRLVEKHGYDCKNAAHLIRLLRMCVEFLDTGVMNVYREHDGDHIRAIKAGKFSLEDVKQEAEALFEQTRVARDRSSLPDAPQLQYIEEMLVDITLDAWSLA